jgi:uncharacterized protein YcaQ
VNPIRTLTPTDARRLAITRQRLAGPRPPATREGIMEVVRDLGCLQLDPTNVVARSHLLVLWSRIGVFDPTDLEALRWKERKLFEYWAHRASIVPTEDYPIHHLMMRRYPSDRYAHSRRTRAWLEQNPALRRHVLARLRRAGPLRLRDFEDRTVVGWQSGGWTSGRNVERMLDVLWTQGKVVVAGRSGVNRLWDLADRWLPEWTPRQSLPEREVVRRASQRSLRALGVATAREIENHFTYGRYPGLAIVLTGLEKSGFIEPVRIQHEGVAWPGVRYVHAQDAPLMERISAGEWEPRTTLLSPFDNLIIERQRMERLFEFRYRMEIYVPKAQRRFGYFAMPVLHGDRLIGLVDPALDRSNGRLLVNAVNALPDPPAARSVAKSVAGAVEDLARFVGATDVNYIGPVPDAWRPALR